MRGGGDHISKWHRVGVDAGSDQTGNVCHVHKQECTDLIGNSAETWEIQHAGIGREASHDHFGFVLNGKPFDFVIVDQARVGVQAVLYRFIQLAGEVDACAVSKVTAMGQ